MDEHLISAWNSRVRPNDSVYILGDLIFRSTSLPDSYLSRLHGKKHMILGNHDTAWIKKADMSLHFASVERYAEISDGQRKITLCHYPLMSWHNIARGSYMIHGHIHNNRDAMYFPLMRQMPNLLNAGVDINNFQPVKFDELIANNAAFKAERTNEVHSEFMNGIGELAKQMQNSVEQALYQFTPIAEGIIAGRITEEDTIDHHLSSMLDFCYDDTVLLLFKRVLRSLYKKYPDLVSDYVHAYFDVWGGE